MRTWTLARTHDDVSAIFKFFRFFIMQSFHKIVTKKEQLKSVKKKSGRQNLKEAPPSRLDVEPIPQEKKMEKTNQREQKNKTNFCWNKKMRPQLGKAKNTFYKIKLKKPKKSKKIVWKLNCKKKLVTQR